MNAKAAKPMRLATVTLMLTLLAISGCGKTPKEAAVKSAREYVRNAVGKAEALVWDEMVCNYDGDDKLPAIMTGYVNSGKGPQLFIANVDPLGKVDGDVTLKPLTPLDNSEIGYWMEVEAQ